MMEGRGQGMTMIEGRGPDMTKEDMKRGQGMRIEEMRAGRGLTIHGKGRDQDMMEEKDHRVLGIQDILGKRGNLGEEIGVVQITRALAGDEEEALRGVVGAGGEEEAAEEDLKEVAEAEVGLTEEAGQEVAVGEAEAGVVVATLLKTGFVPSAALTIGRGTGNVRNVKLRSLSLVRMQTWRPLDKTGEAWAQERVRSRLQSIIWKICGDRLNCNSRKPRNVA